PSTPHGAASARPATSAITRPQCMTLVMPRFLLASSTTHAPKSVANPMRWTTTTMLRRSSMLLLYVEKRLMPVGSGPQVSHREHGAQSRVGGLGALVLAGSLEARAVDALLLVVDRQHAEADGLARVERDAREAVGRGRRNVLEVRRAASQDDAEGDDRVGAVLERRLRDDRQLEGARHAHDAVVGVRLHEHALGARDEALRDALVPRAGDDDHADPRRVDAALLGLSRSAHCAASSFMRATAARISASPMMCPMRSRLVSRYWWL